MSAIPISKLSLIDVGRHGENLAKTIEIDVRTILEKWPDAIISLLVKRKGDTEPYFSDTYVKGGILYWPITQTETAVVGEGKIEIHAVSGNVIAKSVTATMRVASSLTGSASTEPPDVHPSWIDDLMHRSDQKLNSTGYSPDIYLGTDEKGRVVEKASPAFDVKNGITFTPSLSEEGVLSWSNDGSLPNPEPVDITGPQGLRGEPGSPGPRGETGLSGTNGKDGISPSVAVTAITGGHRVNINDANGTHVFEILDGKNGQAGASGKDGISPSIVVKTVSGGHHIKVSDASGTQEFDVLDGAVGETGPSGKDGSSPSVLINEITGGHRVSITDASGTQTFEILDGKDGQAGESGQDGSPGINWRGLWSDLISYRLNDAVLYEGSAYIYVGGKNPPEGITPTDYPDEWSLLASKGDTGVSGQKGADGKTPVKGTDYFTAAEKSDFLTQIKGSLPSLQLTGISKDGSSHTWTIYGLQA